MKLKWKILLPVVGLLLFSWGSYESFAHTWFPMEDISGGLLFA